MGLAAPHLGQDPPDRLVRSREGVCEAGAVADGADEIDQHHVEAAPTDLGADEESALGIERHRHRGLADPAALRLAPLQQPVGLEVAHDHRDGLRREPGQAGDLGLGERAVPPHQGQDQPFVLQAHSGLIRSPLQRRADRQRRLVAQAIALRRHRFSRGWFAWDF